MHKRKFLNFGNFSWKNSMYFFQEKICSIKPAPFDPVNYRESIEHTFSMGQWARFRDIEHKMQNCNFRYFFMEKFHVFFSTGKLAA